MRFAISLVVILFVGADPALADLYRWVDPETGSVKFSSYPPPWFGDAQRAGRAPKVDVIAPTRSAPAFGPDVDRDAAAAPGAALSRSELLRQISQRVAALAAAAPGAVDRPYLELAESLQALEQLEAKSKSSNPNPREEAARLEEKWQLAAPLEARRLALTQQIAVLRPPPQSAAPEAIAGGWRTAQQLLSALEKTNEALTSIDPRKLNSRHFEMRALTDKVAVMWEPYADIVAGRADRGR